MYSGCYYQPVCHLIIIRMNSACKSTCIHLRLMYGWIQDVYQLLSGAAYPTGCSQPVDYLLCMWPWGALICKVEGFRLV